MRKLTVILDPDDEVLSECIKFIASVLGDEKFVLEDHVQLPQNERNKQFESKSKHIFQGSENNPQLKTKSNDIDRSNLHIDQLCLLPVLVDDSDDISICYAGLCTVIRRMVHYSHKVNENDQAISLLGYQETCLKGYAEVSNWTCFCENDFPNAIKMQPKEKSNDTRQRIQSEVPFILLKLEKELATQKNLPNKSKYIGKNKEKWLTKLVSESFEGQVLKGSLKAHVLKLTERIDDQNGWSPYLIGFQITIADLIVLYMVAELLCKLASQNCLCELSRNIPLVFEWIEMMKIIPSIQAFIQEKIGMLFNQNIDSVDGNNAHVCTSWLVFQGDVDPVSQTKFEQRTQKYRVDHQSQIGVTLKKLKSLGFGDEILDLSDIEPLIDWEAHSDNINPAKGDLNVQRSIRKKQQIANILSVVASMAKPGYRIVDFCAGGGHLGIVLAYFLTDCEVVLVENKEESVCRAMKRIKDLKLKNIKICHTNLDYFRGEFDIGVSLHACGIATDLALNMCYKKRASFVVCPCCYGSINSMESVSYPRSQQFCSKITLEDYMILSHSSDMTTWDEFSERCQSGRSSMALIDLDRCLFMEECGYETSLRVMVPRSCSPKNHLLVGSLNSFRAPSCTP